MERILRSTLKDGKFQKVTAANSRRMSAIKSKGNKTTERRLRSALVSHGVVNWKVNPVGLTGNPDFYFPSSKLAVFVDGCFWHGCPKCGHVPSANNKYWSIKLRRNRERDLLKTKLLAAEGIKVLRFWEHDIQADIRTCVALIQKSINRKKAMRYSASDCNTID